MIINSGFHITGVTQVTLINREDMQPVEFIRKDLVEQREADLLGQLEVAEDTVDVLEQLLKKYAEEVQRLQRYNDALRLLPPISSPAIPTPPAPSTLPWVWDTQPSITPLPWQFPTQITSLSSDHGLFGVAINGQDYLMMPCKKIEE